MKEKLLFCFCITLLTTTGLRAQGRTITNFDLEKYRNERVRAETELKENYAQLGFLSPEERARRDAESARQAQELSSKLRAQRIEQERINSERERSERLAAAYLRMQQQETVYQQPYWGGYWGTYWQYSYRLPRPRPIGPQVFQPGYFAGGNFWKVGSPIIIPGRKPSKPHPGPRR